MTFRIPWSRFIVGIVLLGYFGNTVFAGEDNDTTSQHLYSTRVDISKSPAKSSHQVQIKNSLEANVGLEQLPSTAHTDIKTLLNSEISAMLDEDTSHQIIPLLMDLLATNEGLSLQTQNSDNFKLDDTKFKATDYKDTEINDPNAVLGDPNAVLSDAAPIARLELISNLLKRVTRDTTNDTSIQVPTDSPPNLAVVNTGDQPTPNLNDPRKNNPSIDEIISGIVQLLGGNVQVSRPPTGFRLRPSAASGRRPSSKRINDRGPAKFASSSVASPIGISNTPSESVHPTPLVSLTVPTSEISSILGLTDSDSTLLPSTVSPSFPSSLSDSVVPLSTTVSFQSNFDNNQEDKVSESDSKYSSKVQYVFVEVDDVNKVDQSAKVSMSDKIPSFNPTTFTKLYSSINEPQTVAMIPSPSMSITADISEETISSISGEDSGYIPISLLSKTNQPSLSTDPTITLQTQTIQDIQPTPTSTSLISTETDIVYGKPSEAVKRPPTETLNPSKPEETLRPSESSEQSNSDVTVMGTGTFTRRPNVTNPYLNSPTGRPYIIPVEIEEVRPFIGPYPGRPGAPGSPPMSVGGMDTGRRPMPPKNTTFPNRPGYGGVSHGTNSKRPGSPYSDHQGRPPNGNPSGATPSKKVPTHFRPPLRPRPNTPLVRIDTCIVGDDSTCDVQLNERCLTELGVSSCHCRPGFARTFPRGPCIPIVAVSLSMKIDRFADRPLTFNKNFLDTSSEEYRLLEQETTQAMNTLFSYTSFSRSFMGATVDKFYPGTAGLLVNTTIQLEENESNKHPVLQRLLQQEVLNALTSRNLNIGDSSLFVNSPRPGPTVQDINECELVSANDCSSNGVCQNTFGSFRCTCKPGYIDKFPTELWKSGRTCSVCLPTFCSSHGECVITDGKRECKCRGNYIGSRCEIDGEVLGVALGASLAALVIIILTLVCLCIWNRRWKHDQQKAGMVQNHAYTMAKKNGHCPNGTHYRVSMEDRLRRLNTHSYLYHQQQPHQHHDGHLAIGAGSPPALPPPPPPISTCPSNKHIYATPSRLLLQKYCEDERNHTYGHVRSKSRSSQLAIGPPNPPSGYYDLNEFPTRDHYGSHYGNANTSKSNYY